MWRSSNHNKYVNRDVCKIYIKYIINIINIVSLKIQTYVLLHKFDGIYYTFFGISCDEKQWETLPILEDESTCNTKLCVYTP